MERMYLDHNATTPTDPRVLRAMLPHFSEEYGNASSPHGMGNAAREAVETARAQLAAAIGGSPEGVVFTSCGSESDNWAIKGAAWARADRGRHIITSAVEHEAVLEPCRWLEKQGFEVTYLRVDSEGRVDPHDVADAIGDDTILVSIMTANNEIGTVQPIAEIGRIARERGVLFHTDAVQALGKVPVDVHRMNADLVSLSGHKVYAPKGVGALYVGRGAKLTPLIHGGHHESGRRAGTENVPYIVGFGLAAELAVSEMPEAVPRMRRLRDKLCQGIADSIPDVHLNGSLERSLPNTLNIGFHYIEGEGIVLSLDYEGVCVSTGSACSSGSLEPSHVITALGVPADRAQGSIRFSLGKDNTEEDIERVLAVLPPAVKRLRAMSPLYHGKASDQ